ncbi:MAG: hypothetical protein ACD_38C00193G0002 [uncultured bacterium]|uniref:Uncharacterized protein n=1 Tax=Candidatus Daviesbacteria bacterium GW2011_GWC2_40_12 TaxID=1618431 RepID=A0A0G0QMB0_9BACT|nr:MAG: hypothetical protein ACD_38C00193G0002 [uncultured bacterium]KKR41569.1 MAG: hypothetical protein UT77_C0009G0027 [Candidatus Daviesbacteria bacterium GW2011_GWC2_40_12]OGE22096.1 MAG: hypothetical protein A2778_02195 [Candidatus Daviesbacteria bacterium RIFCSPHIGHO2_01_FULL_40_24]OGE28595.1 MAG: hypothetical protein A3C29_03255 [Candidatus Daviesbacteria bacterium RIFCSPHIGHO2_02_FULL_40_16]OGE42995.1 MAG: hypothetical protein A3A53_06785 [Candidatus Daviesbacteria bacterium RIFCSPLOWO
MKKALDFIKNNFVYFLAGFAVAVALISLIIGQLSPQKPPVPTNQPIPVFNPSPASSVLDSRPVGGESYQKVTKDDLDQFRKDSLVSKLIKMLPYTGTNFSLEYDYSTNRFFYALTSGQEARGNEELDLFLKNNQVESRTWLKNLMLKSN